MKPNCVSRNEIVVELHTQIAEPLEHFSVLIQNYEKKNHITQGNLASFILSMFCLYNYLCGATAF